jgi:ubiquinone/menaquinone biosynthesis C-methylase UbiE
MKEVNYLSVIENKFRFEELYLRARSKEQRVLSDEMVKLLPYIKREQSVHYKEWKARAHTFERLRNYFGAVNSPKKLMDLGCGNGWLAAGLAQNECLEVCAVDINDEELKQGARVFHRHNLGFYYGNINEEIFSAATFDFIILNACAQYFENLNGLVQRLFYFLKKGGEIHILDTPFYTEKEASHAKRRTAQYYQSIGFPEMATFYFHHVLEELAPFDYEILSGKTIFHRAAAFFTGDVPDNFYWIKIARK